MPRDEDDKQRAIGYIRLGPKEKGLSAASQRAKLEAYCDDSDLDLVEVFTDIDVEADVAFDKRPGLSKAIYALPGHDATILLATSQERFALSPLVGLFIEHMCEERASARMRVADDRPIDWGDGADAARSILAQFAAAEQAVDDAIGFGDRPGDWAVVEAAQNLSIEKRATDPKTNQSVRIKLSLRQIAEELEKRGYKDRRGNKFSTLAVSRMLEMSTPQMVSRKIAGDIASGLVAMVS